MRIVNFAIFTVLFSFAGATLMAKSPVLPPNPGFVGPRAGGIVTVKEILDNPTDDMRVVLLGNVTSQISDDKFTFADKTGNIVVEIDNKNMPADQKITPETSVKLFGKVKKDWNKIKVDIKFVEVQK